MEKNICPGCKCSVEKCRCININDENEQSIGKAKIAKSERSEEKKGQDFSARSIGHRIEPRQILGIKEAKLTKEDLIQQ